MAAVSNRKGGTCKVTKVAGGVTLTCVLPAHAQKKHNDGTRDWFEGNTREKKTGSIFPLPDGRYAAEIRLDSGKKKRVSAKTKRQVEEKLKLLRRDVDAGKVVQSGSQTVSVWLTHWLANLAEHKPKTAETNRSMVNKHIIPAIGSKRLDKLTTDDVRRIRIEILDKGLSPSTALRAHSVFAAAMDQAFQDELVTENIVKRVKRPKKAAATVPIITPDDAMNVLRATYGDRLGSRLIAAFYTGARQGELLGLELDRVNFIRNTLDITWQLQAISWQHGCAGKCGRIRGTDCPDRKLNFPADWEHRHLTGTLYLARPKSKAGKRPIPIVPVLRAALEQRVAVAMTEPNPHGLVWTSDPKKDRHGRLLPLDGSPILPGTDSAYWHCALDLAGVGQAPLHAARHTTASLLLRAKIPVPIIIAILGHNSFVTSIGYMDIDDEQKLEALTAATAYIPSFEMPAITAGAAVEGMSEG